MHSEFTKRIFTSIILLIGIFSFLKYANEDFFLGFILIIGFICYFEWLLVNSDTLGDRNFYKNSSIHLFGFFYFLLVLPTSAFYLRFDINLNFFYLILIVCSSLASTFTSLSEEVSPSLDGSSFCEPIMDLVTLIFAPDGGGGTGFA